MDAYHILLVFLCSEAIRMVCGWLYADTVVPHTRMIGLSVPITVMLTSDFYIG